jgi:hypothetical protein
MIVATTPRTISICTICRSPLPNTSQKSQQVQPRRSKRLNPGDHEEEDDSVLNRVQVSCCRGEYHATCLLLWIKVNASCPLCRLPLLDPNNQALAVLSRPCTLEHIDARNEKIRRISTTLCAIFLLILSFMWILREWYSNGFFHIFIMMGVSTVTVIFGGMISFMIYDSTKRFFDP